MQDASDDMAANLRGKGGRKREKRYGIVVRTIPANITNSFYRLFNENFAGKEERWRLRSDIKVYGFGGGLLLSVLWFGFKFLFTLLLIVTAIGEWSLVGWKMRRFPIAGSEELAYWAEWLYVVMMAVILLYLIVWTVAGLTEKVILFLPFVRRFFFLLPILPIWKRCGHKSSVLPIVTFGTPICKNAGKVVLCGWRKTNACLTKSRKRGRRYGAFQKKTADSSESRFLTAYFCRERCLRMAASRFMAGGFPIQTCYRAQCFCR